MLYINIKKIFYTVSIFLKFGPLSIIVGAILLTFLSKEGLVFEKAVLVGIVLAIYPGIKTIKYVDESYTCEECGVFKHKTKLKKLELEEPRKEFGKTVREIHCCNKCYLKLSTNSFNFITER